MSAEVRAGFARGARAVLGAETNPAIARAEALRRATARPAARMADLDMIPAWLPDTPAARARFIDTAGIAAIAPELARVIDGTILRKIADRLGPDLVDWALRVGPDVAAASAEVSPDPDIDGVGATVIRTALPDSLAPYFPGSGRVSADRAAWALARARAFAA